MKANYSLISQLLIFILVLIASTTTYAAVSIHWEVDGYFDDGGRVDGGFNFDPDTDSFSNITLYTTRSENVGGGVSWNYSTAHGGFIMGSADDHFGFFDVVHLDSVHSVFYVLEFSGFDPRQPGLIWYIDDFSETENHTSDTEGHAIVRSSYLGIADGTLTSPIPEPETYAMLLSGLGLLGFLAKRRKKAGLTAA